MERVGKKVPIYLKMYHGYPRRYRRRNSARFLDFFHFSKSS